MNRLKVLPFLFILALAIFNTSCGKDEICAGVTCASNEVLTANCDCVAVGTSNEVNVTTNITTNTTWTADKVYILTTRIAVESGATLTIEPGTIIKGEAGAEANATALVIARGAKIMAEGTAANPIIFTTVADEIVSGQIQSPNIAPTLNGLWGGVIILGNAPISADAASVQIEGIPPSDQNGLYGGTDVADNSGVFKYVSIRHGGTDIGEGNEINGLTLGGVGNGTVIDHVEIISNVDDGFEFFGGSVNATNLIVWNQGDDAYDCDQSFSGTIDNFIYIGGESSDHGLELDGAEGAGVASFTLKNGSLKGYNVNGTGGGEYCDFRAAVNCKIEDCYFFNFSDNADLELDGAAESANWTAGVIDVVSLEFNTSHLTSGNLSVGAIFVDKAEGLDAFAGSVPDARNVTTRTVGADVSQFTGWTLIDALGSLEGF